VKLVKGLSILAFLVVADPASAQNPPAPGTLSSPALARMRARIDSVEAQTPFDYQRYQSLIDSLRPALFRLIEEDGLRTPGDFFTASSLAFDPSGFFENRRLEHEMALAAFVVGQPGGLQRVAFTWDGLNLSMGLGQRIGSYARDGVPVDMDRVAAPEVVRTVFKDFASARARSAAATNNAELQALRDADQADRAGPIDKAKMDRMAVEDPKRRARVIELVTAGASVTGRDMHNAATVLQHGGRPDDYRLAHELSIAAFALGDTTALWLISRSYDRLLLRLGHRQRLATQFRGITLQPIDTVGTSDRVRALLGGRKLADVRAGARP
jgi:hypothetical protein